MQSCKLSVLFLLICSTSILGLDSESLIKGKFFQNLSEYGFFTDLKNQIPATEVLPYQLNSQLFSDYTDKQRFIYVPENSKFRFEKDRVFQFPVGTTLIKTFSFQNTTSDLKPQLLETRLLIHTNNGWEAIGYIWNNEQTDAELSLVGKTIQTTFSKSNGELISIRYRAPNKNQCKECHQLNDAITPIGPKARNMNLVMQYNRENMNQLEKWAELGWIERDLIYRKMVNYSDNSNTVEDRARGYLDINCAHCHIQGGSADTTGLYLTLEENNPKHLGFFKKPVATGNGSFNLSYSIVPGKPEESILLSRMHSLEPGIMMPESGRILRDVEGIKIVRDWITSL
ncbi:MAG: SO2930 family diheme c-type cytochrome [Gammaproteobacteria bacterium]